MYYLFIIMIMSVIGLAVWILLTYKKKVSYGVLADEINRRHGCPDCGGIFLEGPGGAGQNVKCSVCGNEFNLVIYGRKVIMVERIIRSDDRRPITIKMVETKKGFIIFEKPITVLAMTSEYRESATTIVRMSTCKELVCGSHDDVHVHDYVRTDECPPFDLSTYVYDRVKALYDASSVVGKLKPYHPLVKNIEKIR